MPKKPDNLQGALDLLILKTLASQGPLHGYGIALRIESVSGDVLRVEEGSLYPALYRMEEDGWIKAKWTTTENNRRARVYEITARGRKELDAALGRWRAVTAAVDQVLASA